MGYNQYAFTDDLRALLDEYEVKYSQMANEYFALPSVQTRLEKQAL